MRTDFGFSSLGRRSWALGLRSWALGLTLRRSSKTKDLSPKTTRSAFTLVELMVAITIIGILSAMALGGMYRANVSAKQLNSKTTVNKVAMQINEIWESYRSRKLPIDPKQMLQSGGGAPYQYQYPNALAWLTYFSQVRKSAGINPATDPINVAPTTPLAFANNIQVSAIKLAATRELMRLELPCRFLDFTDNPAAINPPTPPLPPAINSGTTPAVTTLLIPQPRSASGPAANPGGLSEQYRQFFIAHYNAVAVPYDPRTSLYEPAECLYMIIKFASQNELGQKSIADDPRLVGDADGDGMPEIQDAFNAGLFTPPAPGSPYTQHNHPISFLRWPLGFVSDLQPQPALLGPNNMAQPYNYQYAALRHDIFDPLRIDPRAVTLTPLVYSAGPDTENGLFDYVSGYSNLLTQVTWDDVNGSSPIGVASLAQIMNDPYYIGLPVLPGLGLELDVLTPAPLTGTGQFADNITNHLPSTSRE